MWHKILGYCKGGRNVSWDKRTTSDESATTRSQKKKTAEVTQPKPTNVCGGVGGFPSSHATATV